MCQGLNFVAKVDENNSLKDREEKARNLREQEHMADPCSVVPEVSRYVVRPYVGRVPEKVGAELDHTDCVSPHASSGIASRDRGTSRIPRHALAETD